MSEIIKVCGTWLVTSDGIECPDRDYDIPKERLGEDNWLYHMDHKRWCVWDDFALAYYTALELYPPRAKAHEKAKPVAARQRFRIMLRDGYRCCLCGASGIGVVLHVDHIHPRTFFGTSDDGNLQTLCRACNLGKSDDIKK